MFKCIALTTLFVLQREKKIRKIGETKSMKLLVLHYTQGLVNGNNNRTEGHKPQ